METHLKRSQQMESQLEGYGVSKIDRVEYLEFVKQIDQKQQAIIEGYSQFKDRMLANENYTQKYQPLVIQRQITECLECIMDKKTKGRLAKFNELKMPILREPLFVDQGNPDLAPRLIELREELLSSSDNDQEKFVKTAMLG